MPLACCDWGQLSPTAHLVTPLFRRSSCPCIFNYFTCKCGRSRTATGSCCRELQRDCLICSSISSSMILCCFTLTMTTTMTTDVFGWRMLSDDGNARGQQFICLCLYRDCMIVTVWFYRNDRNGNINWCIGLPRLSAYWPQLVVGILAPILAPINR